MNRYHRETGRHLPSHMTLPDLLESLARWRNSPRHSAAFATTYMPIRRRAMRPVRLPADRKPVPALHPVFSNLFASLGVSR